MEEVKSRAKWWNNEVVVPSLRTSLCILSGPGALPRSNVGGKYGDR